MAIERGATDQQLIEHSLRVKQRDYTIPDRLNQPHPLPVQWRNKIASSKQESNDNTQRMIQQPISSSKSKWIVGATLLVVATTIVTLNATVCHCDTQLPANNNHHQSSYSPPSTKSRPTTSTSTTKSRANSQKESLLAMLSETIERQHKFNLNPARALIQERPSKHDSGEDDSAARLNFASASQFIQKSSKPRKSSAVAKADESMQQIVRMHELHAQPAASGVNKVAVEQAASKKWRDMSHRPVREMAALLIKPNNVVTQAISYISPLVGSKLVADSSVVGADGQQGEKTKLLGLHPFAGRSNTNQPTTSSSSPSKGFWPLRKSFLLRPFATVSPQTSSLSRPSNNKAELSTSPTTLFESGNFNSKPAASHKQSSDPIADLLADSSEISSILDPVARLLSIPPAKSHPTSAPPLRPLPPPKSLDLSTRKSTLAAVSVADVIKSEDNPKSQVTDQVSSQSVKKKKNSANNKAQSYLKNSFRDLLTLSQLPILSGSNPISTAPSVLEKKSHTKPRGAKKAGGSVVGQQDSTDPRKRIFEELYRYIYMLGTGVRNKRDPLEALGSSPSPNSIALTNHNQKGVFSQRSINQLIAANHNQMLNYARKFRSILTTGPMSKAKPRGVMWDMATDPSLAVTVFHLLERASVALPLG